MQQVNQLFEREPETRMLRILGDRVRAFLSDRYARMDNYDLLSDTLPALHNLDVEHQILSSNVNDDNLYLKVVITDENYGFKIGEARGTDRIMRPGFRLSNSETGRGSLKMEGFFFDSYCLNGCVFGKLDAFTMSHTHLGGRVIEGTDFEVISQETEQKRRETVASEIRDGIRAVTSLDKVEEMANILRRAAEAPSVKHPIAAVDLAIKELSLTERERDGVLETFLRDQDYSQYGLSAAITEQANAETVEYERACELETIGGQVIDLTASQWNRFVHAEPEKIAA